MTVIERFYNYLTGQASRTYDVVGDGAQPHFLVIVFGGKMARGSVGLMFSSLNAHFTMLLNSPELSFPDSSMTRLDSMLSVGLFISVLRCPGERPHGRC